MTSSITQDKFALLANALQRRPRNYAELRKITDWSLPTVVKWLDTLRALNLVHICAFEKDARERMIVQMFTWGPGPDAERPGQSRTDAERMRNLRLRRTKALLESR